MAERLISIQDTNQFQTLCGSFDENLKLLEQRYHVRMICRGEELRIQGDGAQVELAAGAVTALLQMISNGQAITPQSIHYVSDMVDAGSAGQLAELADDDTVCLTAAGKPVHTRTVGQRSYVRAIAENTIVFGLGPAGTGKTYLAVAMAVRAFRRHEVNRIILTRPAVEAGEKLGFLPGDLQDKVDPYLRPLYDGLFDMLGAEAFQRHLERGSIEVAPLAYMRGRTLDNAFIILDEAQNTTGEQMKMFLTRLGDGSRMVITGDTTQIDLPDKQKAVWSSPPAFCERSMTLQSASSPTAMLSATSWYRTLSVPTKAAEQNASPPEAGTHRPERCRKITEFENLRQRMLLWQRTGHSLSPALQKHLPV